MRGVPAGADIEAGGTRGVVARIALALLYVVAFWLPLQYLPTRALHLLPLGFIWLDDAALVLAALLAFALAATGDRARLRTPLDLPLAACVAVGVASAAMNRVSPAHLVLGLRGPLQHVLAFYALWLLRPPRRHLVRLAGLSLALALLQVPVTLVQFLATRTAMSRDLVYGTFWAGASNSIAYYLLFFILPLLGLAAARPEQRRALAAAGALLVPFVLASSRGTLLVLPFLALFATWPVLRERPRALGGVAGLALVGALGLGLFYAYKPAIEGHEIAGELSPRRFYIEQWNRDKGMGRLYYARWIAERMAARGPATLALGVGPSRFSSSAGSYLRPPLLDEATAGGHSPMIPGQLVATFSEYGFLGLLAFGWLVASGILLARRSWAADPGAPDAGLRRGLYAATLFLAVGTPLENVWELPHVAVLAWAAVGWGAISLERRERLEGRSWASPAAARR